MSLSKRVRFDVFKRDDFTCQYCGRGTPAVTLEVDHVTPVSLGGSDHPENLLTACFDCNRGRAADPLDRNRLPASEALGWKAEQIQEREDQIRAYNEVKRAERERREGEFNEVWTAWFEVWDATELERWYLPWESTIRKYIDLLGVDEVLEAVAITGRKFNHVSTDAVRYFIGVLKGKAAER